MTSILENYDEAYRDDKCGGCEGFATIDLNMGICDEVLSHHHKHVLGIEHPGCNQYIGESP